MKHCLASLAILAALATSLMLPSCAEPLPLKVGACYDNACLNVSTVIPARRSGKEAVKTQP